MNRWTWTEVSFQLLSRQRCRISVCGYIGWIKKYSICQFNQYNNKYWDGSAVYSLGPSTWVASGCILLWRIPRPSQDWGLLCNHLIVWTYRGFIKSDCDDVNDENVGTNICDFLPLKFSHYPSRPVLVPELFWKYPTCPVPKSKTPTRRTLLSPQDLRLIITWETYPD